MKLSYTMTLDLKNLTIEQLEDMIEHAQWELKDKKFQREQLLKNSNLIDWVKSMLLEKGKIHAIKEYRNEFKTGLRESKEFIDKVCEIHFKGQNISA
jgi:ribosomal protein L7/L12